MNTCWPSFGWLAPFYDAEYGSASFVAVNGPAELELKVSTSGLVLRPVGASVRLGVGPPRMLPDWWFRHMLRHAPSDGDGTAGGH